MPKMCSSLRSIRTQARGLALVALVALMAAAPLGCASDGKAKSPPAGPGPDALALKEALGAGPVPADPLFWRVTPDGGATLYLLGSIHFGPPAGWQLSGPVVDAFNGSGTLVVEADDRGIDQNQMQSIIIRHALNPPGSTLRDMVSVETYGKLEAYLRARGESVDTMQPFRPWMVATVLTMSTVNELGFSAETGVDRTLLGNAGEREVIPLETIESQLEIFSRLSPQLDALFLKDTLDQLGEAGTMLLDMAQDWRVGDEPGLAELLSESLDSGGELAELHDSLIVERNKAMTRALAALARDPNRAGQDVFVVVGAAHFVGEANIRQMLERDYDLTSTALPSAVAATDGSRRGH